MGKNNQIYKRRAYSRNLADQGLPVVELVFNSLFDAAADRGLRLDDVIENWSDLPTSLFGRHGVGGLGLGLGVGLGLRVESANPAAAADKGSSWSDWISLRDLGLWVVGSPSSWMNWICLRDLGSRVVVESIASLDAAVDKGLPSSRIDWICLRDLGVPEVATVVELNSCIDAVVPITTTELRTSIKADDTFILETDAGVHLVSKKHKLTERLFERVSIFEWLKCLLTECLNLSRFLKLPVLLGRWINGFY